MIVTPSLDSTPRSEPRLPITLSVVVPARDEAENLARLHEEVAAALDPLGIGWELIVVDDGSMDDTPARLAALAACDERVRSLRLEPSRGQTAALVAGFQLARGDYLATLDGDLQCPPSDLPPLLPLLERADLACGVRTGRQDPFSRRLASAFSNAARGFLVAPDVRDLACPLRVFRRSALAEVERMTPLFDGAHRWLPVLFRLAGLRIVQRPVVHRARTAGTSKYTTRGRVRPVLRELGQVLHVAVRRPGRVRTLLVVGVLAAVVAPLLYGLGAWPLIEPDEGRNAEIAREMLASGQWSVPHFNGLPYLDKPVLLFWMIAGFFRTLGVNEMAARLPSALAGVATVALTFELGSMLVGWRRGLLAAVVVATTPIVAAYARLVIFDLPLTAFATATLCCLVRARLDGDDRVWLLLAGLAMGLAVLTKGPVGVAVPLVVWFAGRGALPGARRGATGPLLAALVVAAVVVPWLVVVVQQRPDFLRYALVDETFLRLTSTDHFHRDAPVYFYLETLAWGLGLWGVLLLALVPALVRVWRAGGRDGGVVAFAARGTVALLVFFTLSASKRPHYILPAIVPLALLVAIGVDAARARATAVIRASACIVAVIGAGALVALLAGMHAKGDYDVFSRHVMFAVGIVFLGWATVVLTVGRTPSRAVACAALLTPALGFGLIGPFTIYAEARSSRTLAQHVTNERLFSFETFRTSLPFYLGQPVPLVSRSARSFTSNYLLSRPVDDLRPALVPPATLRALVAGEHPPLVITSHSQAQALRKLSARPFETVYTDRVSVVLRPTS
jgi:4-amino-4-deoxy-L-arabinose transferase-like glycosyltransferase